MDVRLVIGAVLGFFIWAYHAKVTFILMGYQFVIPVLVLIAFFLALAALVLIALIVRSLMTGQTVIGGT